MAKTKSLVSSDRRYTWGLATGCLIVLLTLVAYVPALRAGFIWDDDDYVTQNDMLRSATGLARIWTVPGAVPQYYPLTFTSFWIDYHLWGLRPLPYHLENVLLHALAAVMLWRILARLNIPGAWLAAAVFALHPVEVESVAWVTERKNVLSGLLVMAAAMEYLKFRFPSDQARARGPWPVYALSILLFIGAMLSKTTAAMLPPVLLILCWWKRRRLRTGDAILLSPLFAIGIVLGLVTAWLEKHHVGAAGATWSLDFAQRMLVAGRAVWFYLGKIVWPANLAFIYPRWDVDPAVWWQWLYPAAVLGVVVALWVARRRIGAGPFVAAVAFILALFPALGFFDVYPFRYSFVADHFQYLGSAVMIAALVALLARLLPGRPPIVRRTGALALLAILATLTFRQAEIYRDPETLWNDTIARNPSSWMAHVNLGRLFAQRGELGKAARENRRAIELAPDEPEAHYNLATFFAQRGDFDQAAEQYEKAIALRPHYFLAQKNLGVALVRLGKLSEALPHLARAVQMRSDDALARQNYAAALLADRQYDAAVEQLDILVKQRPRDARARLHLADALSSAGQVDKAIAVYQSALQLDPNLYEALVNLGRVLIRTGNLSRAEPYLRQAARLRPNQALPWLLMGQALEKAGDLSSAATAYQNALRADPSSAEARERLHAISQQTGVRRGSP